MTLPPLCKAFSLILGTGSGNFFQVGSCQPKRGEKLTNLAEKD
ncbi:hypothetical protein JavanS749_0018 [Streptococcus satellite phage Javan749]|nr:hypothetical protein JavanS749_0018 [Streptococcus satellite phage Javan749]